MIVTAGRIGEHQTDLVQDCEGISRSLKATDYKNPQKIQVPISMTQKSYHKTSESPTLTASGASRGRGNNSPVHGVMVFGIYTGTSRDFARSPIEGISRCLKSEKHDAGVIHYLVYQFFRNCLDHINSYAVTGLLVQLAVAIDRLGLFEIVICPSLKPEALPGCQPTDSKFIT